MQGERWLVILDPSEVDAAKALAGSVYSAISLEQAKNGHLAEISGKPIVLWPTRDTISIARSWGRELAEFGEVKLLDCTKGFLPTPSEMVAGEWTYDAFIEWVTGQADNAVNLIELVEANTVYGDSPGFPSAGSPPADLPASDESPPFEDVPLEAYSEASAPLSAVEAHIPYASHEEAAGGPEWGVPVDFWGTEGLPALTTDMMPPAFAEYVLDAAARSGVDGPQIALNCYVACAGLLRCGISLNMQPEAREGRTWREKPILWGAVIGLASTGKGPGMDLALDRFREIASDLRRKNEAQWAVYEDQAKVHDKAMQSYYHAAAKDPNTPKPEAPAKPPRDRLWTDDATKEVVAKLITENPRGKITIIKDELASWFGSFDAYSAQGKSDKDRPDWLSFYESKERYIDRVGQGASYHVESWGGCLLGGIQPEVLARVAAKLGPDGMLQRFMLITNRPKTRPPKSEPKYELTRAWNRLCDNLARMEPRGNAVRLSHDATDFMEDCSAWIDKVTQAGMAPGLDAAVGKWEGLMGRLAITSHCIEDAAQGLDCPSPEVSLATMQQVWRWMKGLLWPHLLHYYGGSADVTPMDKSVRLFADFVLARDIAKIKPHELASKWTHYRREIRTIQQRREFWDAVCMTGWARGSGQLGRSGSIYDRYVINPDAHTEFTHRKAVAKLQAEKYREIAHPAFIAAQREAGED